MKKQASKFLMGMLFVGTFFTACKKDDKAPENEEELITTVQLRFTEVGNASNVLTYTFKDVDGAGGAAPSLNQQIVLAPSKSYTMAVKLLNESVTPAEDITLEVVDEADDHQFYYVPANVNINVSNLNVDSKNLPLGTTSTWTTGAANATAGTVKVVLKHKPGIKAANDPITKGETDIEIDFSARVQ